MNCWATKQCKNEGIGEPTGKDKRAKMGPLINAIRFPLISPTTFINYIGMFYKFFNKLTN